MCVTEHDTGWLERWLRSMDDFRSVAETENEEQKIQRLCRHCTPEFDERASRGLSDVEVKKRWPRFSGHCSECGYFGIKYASWMHYIAGDW